MSDLIVRFYGRFVFVEFGNGDLTALAVNMSKNPEVPADRHDAFLTILERNVVIDPPDNNHSRDTSDRSDDRDRPDNQHRLRPTHRIVGTDLVPYEGARDHWDISGCVIDIPSSGGFEWTLRKSELHVADLGRLSGRTVDTRNLAPNSVTTAVIRLHGGRGLAFDLAEKLLEYEYVRLGDSSAETGEAAGRLADMVQVDISLPGARVDLQVSRNGADSEAIPVVQKPPLPTQKLPEWPIVLSFSNLCTSSHYGADAEFAGFYEVLTDPPRVNDRKIPRAEGLTNSMRPLGDCFLGAMIKA